MKRIITLTTDFGLKDLYVGSMKGVILGINIDTIITDITHQITKYDIFRAAFTVRNFYQYFPSDTIHIVVVDPGVGSSRRPIIIQTEKGIFVGPDNGVFSLILQENKEADVFEITNTDYMMNNVSQTFHGRDIFAPVAAHISKGLDISELGSEIHSPLLLRINKPIILNNQIIGEVVYTDSFGNLITNISADMIDRFNEICIDGYTVDTVAESYDEVEQGKLLAIFGSSGFLEISVNQGSAAETIKDYKVTVRK